MESYTHYDDEGDDDDDNDNDDDDDDDEDDDDDDDDDDDRDNDDDGRRRTYWQAAVQSTPALPHAHVLHLPCVHLQGITAMCDRIG